MARAKPTVSSLVAGELTPRLEGRIDIPIHTQGCRSLLNDVVLPYGGATRAEGREFADEVKNSANYTRIFPFVTSEAEGYVVEAGDLYFRFFTNNGRLGGGSPFEISTPYTSAELNDLQFAQSADVMFIVSPTHPTQELVRTSPSTFTLSATPFADDREPFRAENTTDTTLTVTPLAGSNRDLAFSADIGLTAAKDIGRLVVASNTQVPASTGAVYRITSVANGSTAMATELQAGTDPPAGANKRWALGEQSNAEGFDAVTLHDGRLWLGRKNRIYASQSDDFANFNLGTALDNEAIARTLTAAKTPDVQWMVPASGVLHIGGQGQEFYAKGADDNLITPSGMSVKPVSSVGSAHVQPVVVGDRVLHLQRDRTVLREIMPGTTTTFKNEERSVLAEHILRSDRGGATQMDYAQEPYSMVLCVRGDGVLAAFTREVDHDITAAHRHKPGGSFQGGPAEVESVAVIPAPSGDHDQIWWIVKRTIGGQTKRYVEFWRPPYRPAVDRSSTEQDLIAAVETAFFVDSGLSLDAPVAITAITLGNPVQVTVPSHGLSSGDRIKIRGVVGTVEANQTSYLVSGATADTIDLKTTEGVDVDGTAWTAYVSGGTVREEVSTVAGLDHLEGELVQALADGAPEPPRVVSSGFITLDAPASIVHVGLPVPHEGETQRLLGAARLGAGLGEKSRLRDVSLRLLNTVSLSVGQARGPLEAINLRSTTSKMDTALPLFTGDLTKTLNSGWTTEPSIRWFDDSPLPCTILALTGDLETGEN